MKNALTLLLLSFLWTSCGLNSYLKVREKAAKTKVVQHTFKKKMLVEMQNNYFFIKVKIRENTYNFLFDTGATTCVLDDDFAKALQLKNLATSNVKDANQVFKKIPIAELEQIGIEGIDFQDVICNVSDLSAFSTQYCMPIHGIIGTNLMARAVWQLDYPNSTITFANHKDSLTFNSNRKRFGFNTRTGNGYGIPSLDLRRNYNYLGVTILDTGAGGTLMIANQIFNILADSSKKMTSYHVVEAAHGAKKDTTKIAKISGLNVGDTWTIDNLWITSRRGTAGILGGGFMKDYIVTFDWMYQEVTFEEVKKHIVEPTFGLNFYLKNNKIIVGSLLKNSPADQAGIHFLDEVVSINGKDCVTTSSEQYCELKNNFLKENKLTLKIRQNGEIVEKSLEKIAFEDIFK
jgi:predicted aspartyl protease